MSRDRRDDTAREMKALLSLGRAAARFVVADREAREARRRRQACGFSCERDHADGTPCYRVGGMRVRSYEDVDAGYLKEEHLPLAEWCDWCQHTAPLRSAFWVASRSRSKARASMIASYWRLTRLREG